MTKLHSAYLGFGSNVGAKVETIRSAARMIEAEEGVESLTLSPLYRTAPVGVTDQDWFVNAVARIQTSLTPVALLELCLKTERAFKRVRKERWGPRTLDLDVLLFGEERIDEAGLQVPHPRMVERAFVLAPLADLDPELLLQGKPVGEWLAACSGQVVSRMEDGAE